MRKGMAPCRDPDALRQRAGAREAGGGDQERARRPARDGGPPAAARRGSRTSARSISGARPASEARKFRDRVGVILEVPHAAGGGGNSPNPGRSSRTDPPGRPVASASGSRLRCVWPQPCAQTSSGAPDRNCSGRVEYRHVGAADANRLFLHAFNPGATMPRNKKGGL